MNNKIKILAVGLLTFASGIAFSNFAMSDVPSKIAVVDVQEVVNSSSQVQALKKEQQAKMKEVVSFVEKARKEVAATTDVKKKQALEEKYNKEHNITPTTIRKEIREVISNIDLDVESKNTKKLTKKELAKTMEEIEQEMREAAKNLDFERAMQLRDVLFEMKLK